MMVADTVQHAIQLAVAPVFMLTAIAGLIAALATRLARIIDRARDLEGRTLGGRAGDNDLVYVELRRLKVRGRVVNGAVALLTLSAMLIGATVMALFLSETLTTGNAPLVATTFIAGVTCFVLALMCFFAETLLAGYTLKFKQRPGPEQD